MASPAHIAELTARAQQADSLLATLAERVNTLRGLVEAEALTALKAENVELAKQVAAAKQALIAAEVANGKPQVPLPSAGAVAPAAAPVAAAAAPAAPAPAAAPAAKKEEKKAEKPAKAEKKPAAAAAAEEEKVDVSRLLLKVGRILKAEKHPDADALYLETIDCGEAQPRTVISGLAGKVPLEEMQNRMVVLCANLKPVKMRGILSEAMVMCASTESKVEVIDPPAGAEPGDLVVVEGFPGTADEQLNPKKKIFETVQPDFLTTDDFVATYKGIPWSIKGKTGVFKAQTLAKAPIK